MRSYFTEGRAWLAELLSLTSAHGRSVAQAKALCGAGELALLQGDVALAHALADKSLALHRELGDQQAIAVALNLVGHVATRRGDYAGARAAHQEAITLARALG